MTLSRLLRKVEICRYTANNKKYEHTHNKYMNISRHSIKIAISFLIVLSLALVSIFFDISRINIMQSKLDAITKEHNVKSSLMMIFQHGIYERQVSLRNIMILDDPFDRDEERTVFNSHALPILDARNKFMAMSMSKEEEFLLKEISAAMIVAYHAQVDVIDKSIYGDEKLGKKDLEDAFKTQEIFKEKVQQMINLQENASKKAVMDAESSYKEAKISIYTFGGGVILFGIFIAFIVIRLTEVQVMEIEKTNNMLEERVEKRTLELAKARDAALASNKAKDAFLANMSHELRTPLNIIMGYCELLQDFAKGDDKNEILPDLNKIHSAASHQLELINGILDISKIEEGKLEIYPIDFNVEMLASEVEAATKPLMTKNNNNFKMNCMPDLGKMYSDNMRIRQILLNLLSNAAKFTEEGTISLSITKDVENNEMEFEVQDTGIGVSDDYMGDLFKKFTQEDTTATRKYGGTGLGLSISKQLSHELKGNITVTSKKGKGSRFILRLPIKYVA